MKVLITASNGTIGSRVSKLLKTKPNLEVIGTSRSPKHHEEVQFDFGNEALVRQALKGIDKAILITPASQTELETGVRFVQIAKEVGVKHIVFMSIHQVDKAPQIPHFASKIAIQKELEKSGLLWTSIAPNNFYQNDYWFKAPLLEYGVYPQPFGHVGLNRVDADDIAIALANAVLNEDLCHQVYPLVGPEAVTVNQVCQTFSHYLGKPIQYGGDDLDAWEEHNKAHIPAWLLSDWKMMYAFFQSQGVRATAADFIQQAKVLGQAPKLFETFVQETVLSWKQ